MKRFFQALRCGKRKGFTMMEFVFSIAIITIVGTVVLVQLVQNKNTTTLTAAANQNHLWNQYLIE